MIRNYLRMAFRQIRRNRLYSIINVLCLAAGIAVTMTILLFVLHEHSYDRWHANSPRIFQVSAGQKAGSSLFFNPMLTVATGPAAQEADASVESTMRLYPNFLGCDMQNATQPGVKFREGNDLVFVDSNFFSFFSFKLL